MKRYSFCKEFSSPWIINSLWLECPNFIKTLLFFIQANKNTYLLSKTLTLARSPAVLPSAAPWSWVAILAFSSSCSCFSNSANSSSVYGCSSSTLFHPSSLSNSSPLLAVRNSSIETKPSLSLSIWNWFQKMTQC